MPLSTHEIVQTHNHEDYHHQQDMLCGWWWNNICVCGLNDAWLEQKKRRTNDESFDYDESITNSIKCS